jgi:MFS family permease
MSPSAHLGAINFFIGDIQGGLGPFLSTWLAQTLRWGPAQVGLVSTIVGLATLILNAPAGALADRSGRPRLLLCVACSAILAGTLLMPLFRSFAGILSAEFLAAAGGTLVVPAMTSLTLGIVGKPEFPRQQGRNQAFNHAGILVASALVGGATHFLGGGAAFVVLSCMAAAAIFTIVTTPASAWNGRRAHGWREDEPNEADHKHDLLAVIGNRRLLLLSMALALFNLGNGSMLSLVGQRLVAGGYDATRWTAIYVILAQLTMIPVAIFAGSSADKRGRRHLLLIAFAALIIRAIISALTTSPILLALTEVLDGVGSGLLGVCVPVAVADLTWGSGRTQTALGAVNGLQGLGGALSGLYGGLLVQTFGWVGAFAGLGLAAVGALAIAFWLVETREMGMPYSPPARAKEA